MNEQDDTLNLDSNEFDGIIVNYLNESDEIYINLPDSIDMEQVSLFNIIGQKIKSFENDEINRTGSNEFRIPISPSISEGTYVIKVESNLGVSNKKVIIKL